MNAGFIAWLVGVEKSDVQTYRDVADWPSHWAMKAQHRMRSLGASSEQEAMSIYRTQLIYG